ncbi:hypothetical protein LTR53_002547 [Teratosphaeriaceae sp. CCFEE 6253]|nr:hypothetical protein LTR53_002547 [Teratosphaeriaceae sp. CCFEE 6253]
MAMDLATPPSPATPTSKRHSHSMSLDLSDLPALTQPTPPSNCLLITHLDAPEIFAAANLDSIRAALHTHAPLHTFAPLKSMRRIICTFFTVADAIAVRQVLDGETVLGSRVRVYFGTAVKIDVAEEERWLQAPKSSKMFFISPPPSPPMGWEMRDEGPPNKEVHAEDLAVALSQLHARPSADDALRQREDDRDQAMQVEGSGRSYPPRLQTRPRSGTGTVVYDPQEHGHSPLLPAIAVEDTSEGEAEGEVDGDVDGMEGVERKMVHTARPPVELMET